MNWIILVIITVLSNSLRIFLDNYLSDVYFKGRNSVSQKLFYGFFFIFLALLITLISPPDLSKISPLIPLLLFLSGCLISLDGIPYYKALEIEDSTSLGIFIQLAPVLYLILGWLFLGESSSPLELVAFAVILAAPLLIIFTSKKRARRIKIKAALFAGLYVLLSVSANLIFVKTSDQGLSFVHCMIFLYLGKGTMNLLLMAFHPKWRKRFSEVVKSSHRRVFLSLFIDAFINAIRDFAWRGTLILAPTVALASVATDSATPIAIFFLGLVLTLIWPKFGREKLNRKTILVHFIATILVVVGIILLQL